MPLDPAAIRRHFPILSRSIGGKPLVYLDNAATSQKPEAVLRAMDEYYRLHNANAHRSMHVLAGESTQILEDARAAVARFVKAARPEEIVFTKNCTEAINLVARSQGRLFKQGDAVILSMLEHHSNIVPWLQLKERQDIDILWIDCDAYGQLDLGQLTKFLRKGNVKLLSITAQRNVLGVRPPIADMIRLARDAGALTLVDAAQSVAHHQTDVQALDCDFLAFSGHKLYGPQGIGVLYGKQKLLQAMPPFLGGGMMIWDVTTDSFTPTDIPAKFEAGTQPVAGAAGLQAAIEWLSQFAWKDIEAHEHSLLLHAAEELRNIHGLHLLGPWQTKNEQSFGSAQDRRANEPTSNATSGCLSFTIDGIHPHDLTDILCKQGICLRAGRHCAQPLHKALGVNASTRLSVGIYNTFEEIVAARHGILQAVAMLS